MIMYSFQPSFKIIGLKVSTTGLKAQIQARGAGLFAWLLHLVGLGRTHTFGVSPLGFRIESSSFSGEAKTYVSRPHTSETVFSLSKPVEFLAIAFGLVVTGLNMFRIPSIGLYIALACIAVAILFALLYFLSDRRVTLGIVSDAGTSHALRLRIKGSQLEELRDVVEVMETLVRSGESQPAGGVGKSQARDADDDYETRSPARQPQSQPHDTTAFECPHCGARMQITAAHRGKQVRCPSCKEVLQL